MLNRSNKKILGIIPARGGSKSIPRKNIIKVGGKPLIAWTIESSLKSKYITKTVVSSEDKEIMEVAKKFGADIVRRPLKYATDSAIMTSVIKDCLIQLKKNKEEFDILILLQPTSPLRKTSDIDEAFNLFFKSRATALISGYEPPKSPFKSFKINKNGFLSGLVDNKSPFMNRQSLPKTFYPNGAIYIIYIKEFLKTKELFTSKTIPYSMPTEKSIDLDSLEDIKSIEKIIGKN